MSSRKWRPVKHSQCGSIVKDYQRDGKRFFWCRKCQHRLVSGEYQF